MALVKCRECGKEVSKEAKTCPHCGIKSPFKPDISVSEGCAILVIMVVLLGVLLGYCASSDDDPDPEEVKREAAKKAAFVGRLSIPVSKHFYVHERTPSPEVVNDLIALVKGYGYRCDILDEADRFLFSPGFELDCNGFRYSYKIEDKGGNWIVTVD